MSDDVSFFSKLVRDSMELQAQEALNNIENREIDIMKPLEVSGINPPHLSEVLLKLSNYWNLISSYKLNILLQIRISDLVERSGNGSRMIAQEDSLRLSSRPNIPLIEATLEDRIPETTGENDQTGYDFNNIDSEDGVKYCLLEASDDESEASNSSKEMIDQSV